MKAHYLVMYANWSIKIPHFEIRRNAGQSFLLWTLHACQTDFTRKSKDVYFKKGFAMKIKKYTHRSGLCVDRTFLKSWNQSSQSMWWRQSDHANIRSPSRWFCGGRKKSCTIAWSLVQKQWRDEQLTSRWWALHERRQKLDRRQIQGDQSTCQHTQGRWGYSAKKLGWRWLQRVRHWIQQKQQSFQRIHSLLSQRCFRWKLIWKASSKRRLG